MTLIIAEAGVNHNGSLDIAKKLIDVAAAAAADLVKFQTFTAKYCISAIAPKAKYQINTTGSGESQLAMVEKLELSREIHEELIAHCRKRSIGFFSTGFDLQSLNLLSELGLERFKIPSGEITNLPYLRQVGSYGKQVILSTGMANLSEIEAALGVLEKSGMPRDRVTILHCNTEYPTPMVDVNLRAMLSIQKAFGISVGYSDHTLGIEVPVAAVTMGATVIEKHFTLDRNLPGPDHASSLEPDELKAMVRSIRNIEQALGDGIKRPSPSELKNKTMVRKSLVAAKSIRAGELFSKNNLAVKRPGNGISPMRWDEVIGLYAPRDFTEDEIIEL